MFMPAFCSHSGPFLMKCLQLCFAVQHVCAQNVGFAVSLETKGCPCKRQAGVSKQTGLG